MNDKEKIMHKIRASEFPHNNGKVLRMVNTLRSTYTSLRGIQGVMEEDDIMEAEFVDSVHFLAMEGYIQLRTVGEHIPVPNLADASWKQLEGMLTGKGIRVLQGNIKDDMIEV